MGILSKRRFWFSQSEWSLRVSISQASWWCCHCWSMCNTLSTKDQEGYSLSLYARGGNLLEVQLSAFSLDLPNWKPQWGCWAWTSRAGGPAPYSNLRTPALLQNIIICHSSPWPSWVMNISFSKCDQPSPAGQLQFIKRRFWLFLHPGNEEGIIPAWRPNGKESSSLLFVQT